MTTNEILLSILCLASSAYTLYCEVQSRNLRMRYNNLWQSYRQMYQEHKSFFAEVSDLLFAKDRRLTDLQSKLITLCSAIKIDEQMLACCRYCASGYVRKQKHQKYCSRICKRKYERQQGSESEGVQNV